MLQIKNLACWVIFTALIWPAYGQKVDCHEQLRGIVRDGDGTPLTGATVWVDSLKTGDVTHIDGGFLIQSLCPGSYSLRVSMIGYEDQFITISLPLTNDLAIRMNSDVRVLHEIVVEGEHAQQHGLSQSVST